MAKWKRAGLKVEALLRFADVRQPGPDDTIDCAEDDQEVTFLVVAYDGSARAGETKNASESNYSQVFRVHENDIVVSHINAVNGAVAVVGEEADGYVVSNEYTILRPKEGIDPHLIWALIRSPEARSDLLLLASGIGRHRVKWDNAKMLQLPVPPTGLAEFVVAELRKADEKEREAAASRLAVADRLNRELGLDNAQAHVLLQAFKPPK